MTNSYEDRFSWGRTFSIGDHAVLEHKNGVISIAVEWQGVHTALKNDADIQSEYDRYMRMLHKVPHDMNLVIENHFLRDYTSQIPEKYLEYGRKNIVRHHEFAMMIRHEQANLIAETAMETRVVKVFSTTIKRGIFSGFRIKNYQDNVRRRAAELMAFVKSILTDLKRPCILDEEKMKVFIWQCYHRERARSFRIPQTNNRFRLSNIIATKPSYEDGFLRVGDTYTKCILLIDYEDADTDWFYRIARCSGIEIHITQILKPLDTTAVVQASATASVRSSQDSTDAGAEDQALKVRDHNSFRMFVHENKLRIFGNTYIIKLHATDKEYLKECFDNFTGKILDASSVYAEDNEAIALAAWRFSMPGMGYATTFSRPDHSLQIVNMAPVVSFNKGDEENLHMLRVTSDRQAITLGYPKDGVNHTLTIAKTGSGKGVETGTQILELYPLGVNYYITEVGNSYQWIVESFNGQYYDLDSSTVVSPFPEFKLADPSSKFPLSGDLVGPTIKALGPMIGQGGSQIAHHIESVGEILMQELYRNAELAESYDAPTLEHFLLCAEEAVDTFERDKDRQAAIVIRDNLDSFLNRSSGSNFANADSLSIDSGIAGFNFKGVMDNEFIAKFLLVFLNLRFKQIAFSNSEQTMIVSDEFHEFVRIDRELMLTAAMQLTRMGRKEASGFQVISQETEDAALNDGIINSMQHQNFMYLQSGHHKTAELFEMNSNVMSRWKSYVDPDGLNFRQCIRRNGQQAWDLYQVFPKVTLDLTNTKPKVLEMKKKISLITRDPMERLSLLQEYMARQ